MDSSNAMPIQDFNVNSPSVKIAIKSSILLVVRYGISHSDSKPKELVDMRLIRRRPVYGSHTHFYLSQLKSVCSSYISQ